MEHAGVDAQHVQSPREENRYQGRIFKDKQLPIRPGF
jgi:hypothetical protein